MDALFCNKCIIPIYREKCPYHITQCGHISYQDYLQQVKKQCPQCQQIVNIPLNESLSPTLAPYFQPQAEILETLLKAETFRRNQFKITMQRFHELDKKYERLKTRYWFRQCNLKQLKQKYINLKEKLDKKLLLESLGGNVSWKRRRGNADVETPIWKRRRGNVDGFPHINQH